MKQIGVDFDFFPALRETIMSTPLEQIRRRNELRLMLAKRTDGNVFRPTDFEDQPYPVDEA